MEAAERQSIVLIASWALESPRLGFSVVNLGKPLNFFEDMQVLWCGWSVAGEEESGGR